MYPRVKQCSGVRPVLLRSCWFISFNPLIREPNFQSILNLMSEMGWGHPVGKPLQFHFLLSVFNFCKKKQC